MQVKPRIGRGQLAQVRQPARVDLEGVHSGGALQQRPREPAAGGAHFQHDVLGAHGGLLDDGAQDVGVHEVVLPVAVQRHRPRRPAAVAGAGGAARTGMRRAGHG